MNISLGMLGKKLILVVTLFFTFVMSAQLQEKEYNSFDPAAIAGSMPVAITAFGSSPVTVFDSQASFPNQTNVAYYSYLSINIDNNLAPFQWYELKATFKITPLKQDRSEDIPFTKELVVSYNPNPSSVAAGTNFSDLSYLKIENRFGIKVELMSYQAIDKTNQSIVTPSNAFVNMGFKANRFYAVSEQLPNPYVSANNGEVLNFVWNAMPGAVDYELEWTWIDNYSKTGRTGFLGEAEIPFSERDFELNNTRIITATNAYQIPLIYSNGYLIYRVRAIGRRKGSDEKYYGIWSSGVNPKTTIADWPHKERVYEHEGNKNWQFQASYAEDGKKKEVVSYFDGSLRNRQTVTKINTDNTTVVGEVIYDTQGRPAIEVLPTPTINPNIRFFNNFNLNGSGQPYSSKDFDYDANTTVCGTTTIGMSTSSGSSKYYSPNGFPDFSLRTNQQYVPDAKEYPFSQIEYEPDNTGRIARKSGVGETHQLDSKHEMKYFYGVPLDSKELHRLFGYSVGSLAHYKKNTVIDPNGQVSISYIDPQGRTIATALAESKPDNLDGLDDENNVNPDPTSTIIHDDTTSDLLNKLSVGAFDTPFDKNELGSTGVYPVNDDKLSVYTPVTVTGDRMGYTFKYGLSQLTSFNTNSFNGVACSKIYPFVYDLKLSLRDGCGEILSSPAINQRIGTKSLAGTAESVSFPEQQFEATLDQGKYTLTKELKVNEDALNTYADDYLLKLQDPSNAACYVDPLGFAPDASIDTCGLTCATCSLAIGLKATYVQNALRDFYNTQEITAVGPDDGPIVVTFTGIPAPAFDVAEVNALNVRFSREWELLLEECDKICNRGVSSFSTSCDVSEEMLLGDMTINGQYGATEPTITVTNADGSTTTTPNPDFALSIFNDQQDDLVTPANSNPGSLFYYNTTVGTPGYQTATTRGNNWKNPLTPYVDDLGAASVVVVEKQVDNSFLPAIDLNVNPTQALAADGTTIIYTVLPQQLKNVADFIKEWDDNWSKSLLKYHPEYSYLDYNTALCQLTKSVNVKLKNDDGTISNQTLDLSSDAFDSFLQKTTTMDMADQNGLLNQTAPNQDLSLYNKDPYFQARIANYALQNYETEAVYKFRAGSGVAAADQGIMYHAIKNNYSRNTDGSVSLTLYQAALRTVMCNSVNANCDISAIQIATLPIETQDRIWNTYKGFYLGLKSKMKHVFINTYAYSKKSLNGCVQDGNPAGSAIVNILDDNYPQKAALLSYFENNTSIFSDANSLCASSSASFYKSKKKRFIPADFAYDSGIDTSVALADLVAQADYQYYAQTGNCPLLQDLEIFVSEYFREKNANANTTITSQTVPFMGQYLSPDFLKALIIPDVVATIPSTTPVNIVTNATASTLNYSFTNGGDLATVPVTLVLPATGNYNCTWNNYGAFWKIKALKQFFYNKALSDLDGSDKVFSYQVVAEIVVAGVNYEVLLSGQTCAAIGECGVSGSSIGQVLDPNAGFLNDGSGCDKK